MIQCVGSRNDENPNCARTCCQSAVKNALAILDVKMPEMDGLELLTRLRRQSTFRDLPIVMLTSLGKEEDVVRGFDLGADDYVLKPFSPDELMARVSRLLRRSWDG